VVIALRVTRQQRGVERRHRVAASISARGRSRHVNFFLLANSASEKLGCFIEQVRVMRCAIVPSAPPAGVARRLNQQLLMIF
jgi:hypothetical protein